MGDLDTSLISEFAQRPAFYNKTSPNYKDKVFVEQAWTEIATKLGYNGEQKRERFYFFALTLLFMVMNVTFDDK